MASARLPSGWTWATLGEIGAYHNGRGFRKHEWAETGRPIIRIQNLTDPTKPFNFYPGRDVDPRNEVCDGDILVSWAATLDVFRWRGPAAVLNQHIFKVESYIDPDYHFYVLRRAIEALYARSHGSGMVHITRGRFDAIPVAVPPLAEQRRIASALQAQFALVEDGQQLFKQAEGRLDMYRSATLRAVLGGRFSTFSADVAAALEDAPRVPLRELGTIEYGYTAPAQAGDAGPQMLRITDIQNGGVDWSSVPRCEATNEDVEKYRLLPGDIVFARLGYTTGKSFLIGADAPPATVYASYLIRVRPDARVRPEYLALYFQSATYWAYVYEQRRGIDRPALNGSILGRLPVPVPSLDAQLVAVTEARRQLDAVERTRARFTTLLDQADALAKSLLHAGLGGELVTQAPGDLPASELLAELAQKHRAPARHGRRLSTRAG